MTSKKFLKDLKEIGLTAQIHGIPRIISNERKFLKILWILFFLASVSSFSYTFYRSLFSYLEYDVVTKTESRDDLSLEFPTVTICPLRYPDKKYDLSDVIIDCKFHYFNYCLTEPFFIKVKNKIDQSKDCYQFNGLDTLIKINRPGYINGLVVKLFGGLYEENRTDLFETIHSNGFEVFIHKKSDVFEVDSGIVIHPGEATFVSLKKLLDIKLPKPYNNCTNDFENRHIFDYFTVFLKNNLTSDKFYTQKKCLNLEFLKHLDFNVSNNDLLNSYNKTDIIKKYISFYENETYKSFLGKCPLECESIYYQAVLSHSYYPSYDEYKFLLNNTKLISNFPNKQNTTIDELRKSVYELYVYFEDLKYLRITQIPKMTEWDLVSNIGGLLGLFLGLSFLSFIDLIQILFEFLFSICENKKTHNIESLY